MQTLHKHGSSEKPDSGGEIVVIKVEEMNTGNTVVADFRGAGFLKAEFAGFQSGLEIRDEYIEPLFYFGLVYFGLVEHEEVSSPWHIAHHANSRLS